MGKHSSEIRSRGTMVRVISRCFSFQNSHSLNGIGLSVWDSCCSCKCVVLGVTSRSGIFLLEHDVRLCLKRRPQNRRRCLRVPGELAGEIPRAQEQRVLLGWGELCWTLCASACTYHSRTEQVVQQYNHQPQRDCSKNLKQIISEYIGWMQCL